MPLRQEPHSDRVGHPLLSELPNLMEDPHPQPSLGTQSDMERTTFILRISEWEKPSLST